MLALAIVLASGCRQLTADPPDAAFDAPGLTNPEVSRGSEVPPSVDLKSGPEITPPRDGPMEVDPPTPPPVDAPVDSPPMEVAPSCVPMPEACDNQDNDCDGFIDDNLSMACSSACGNGNRTCTAGVWGACSARMPSAETCDNVDNDCNGRVDDNLTRDCSTTCEPGKETCSGGRWGACSAKKPSNTDVSSCGAACVRCNAAPVGGTPICADGHCDFACNQTGLRAKCNGQCTPCCGTNATTCGAGGAWTCVNNDCSCPGMKCGTECRPPTRGCGVLIRSQGPDPCVLNTAPVGCGPTGPYSDLTTCQIGIVRRQLVQRPEECTQAILEDMARFACRQYIDMNRQPGFDPTKPIGVALFLERFDANARVDYTYDGREGRPETTCAALGVAGSAP